MESHHVFKSYSEVMEQLAAYFVRRRKFRKAAIDYTNGIIEAEQSVFPLLRKRFILSVNKTSETITRIDVTVHRHWLSQRIPQTREEKILCSKFYALL
jgi:hypothetical protein